MNKIEYFVEELTTIVEPSWFAILLATVALPIVLTGCAVWAVLRRVLDHIGTIAIAGSIVYLSTVLALIAGLNL